MKLPKPGSNSFQVAPADTYIGILYQAIDLGTQYINNQYGESYKWKIYLAWELHHDEHKTKDGRPLIIGKTYTMSMDRKASLRKHLESWRGQPFVDSDFDEKNPNAFTLDKLIGKPCMIGVLNYKKEDGNTNHKIDTVTKVFKGIQVPDMHNPPLIFDMQKPYLDTEAFEKVPNWLQRQIAESPEYKSLLGQQDEKEPQQEAQESTLDDEIPDFDNDDEAPF